MDLFSAFYDKYYFKNQYPSEVVLKGWLHGAKHFKLCIRVINFISLYPFIEQQIFSLDHEEIKTLLDY